MLWLAMLGVTRPLGPGHGLGRPRDRGASLVEYALLLALIAAICMGAISMLGGATSARLSVLGTQLDRPGVTTAVDPGATTTPTADGEGGSGH